MASYFDIDTYAPRKGDLPFNPEVQVVLAAWGKNKSGSVILGAKLATADEIDFQIDRMIKELESVRRRAKASLRARSKK